jgi:hypothetical protein
MDWRVKANPHYAFHGIDPLSCSGPLVVKCGCTEH